MWATHKFSTTLKNDHVTSNVAQSFNAWISEFRDKPIYTTMDGIRGRLMVRMHNKRKESMEMNGLTCPTTQDNLFDNRENGIGCKIMTASYNEYVVFEENFTYYVMINERHCTCGEWDLTGVPCTNAIKALTHSRQEL